MRAVASQNCLNCAELICAPQSVTIDPGTLNQEKRQSSAATLADRNDLVIGDISCPFEQILSQVKSIDCSRFLRELCG